MSGEDQCALLESDNPPAGSLENEVNFTVEDTNSSSPPLQTKSWIRSLKLRHVSSVNKWKSLFHRNSCRLIVGVSLIVVAASLISLVIGLLIGRSLQHHENSCTYSGSEATPTTPGNAVPLPDWGSTVVIDGEVVLTTDVFAAEIKKEDIRSYHYNLSELPHIAGSERNTYLAMDMYKEWKNFGFDSVEMINYTVLLSFPDKNEPNTLLLKNSNGSLIYKSHIAEEPPLTDSERNDDVVAPFNAYSGNGTVMGPLVYVNYGTIDDFLYLTNGSFLMLNLSKYICIARYGRIYRGDKAHLAEKFGCKALLLYTDPANYAPSGSIYPEGPNLPEFGIQRGSLSTLLGDPVTPTVPAISGVFQEPYEELLMKNLLPSIPVQPVSYGDIFYFMKQLSQFTPPHTWVGGLNLTYKILQDDNNTNVTELTVNVYQTPKTINNVVAKLYGSIEPDRQVILGNHRDAWVYGAVDPSSGTAVLRSVAKAIGYLRLTADWRPGRTLVLCSWDAEEYGVIGSTEWVEDFKQTLAANTIAYLNVDEAVSGSSYVFAGAQPLLYEPLWQAARAIPSPNSPTNVTIYDEWLVTFPKNYNGTLKPTCFPIGSGSDFVSFSQIVGISCASVGYTSRGIYTVYHSVHDTFNWMIRFGDPTYSHHRATGLFWIFTALSLTNSPLLPGKATDYGLAMREIFNEFQSEYHQVLEQNGISINELSDAVIEFSNACTYHELEKSKVNSTVFDLSQQLLTLRVMNDKLMEVERAFILPEGLPARPLIKHVIFAPSTFNSYGATSFPGIADAIFSATHNLDPDSSQRRKWNVVRRQIDIVRTHLRHATQILMEPVLPYLTSTKLS